MEQPDQTGTHDGVYLGSVYRIHGAVFVDSAKVLADRLDVDSLGVPTSLAAIPFYLLASHAAELCLKSALLKRGATEKALRQVASRHNLGGLLTALQGHGVVVSKETEELVRRLSPQHEAHSLRYTALVDDGRPTYMPPASLVFSALDELLLATKLSKQGTLS